jgi:hypothetical protein
VGLIPELHQREEGEGGDEGGKIHFPETGKHRIKFFCPSVTSHDC